MQKIYLILLVLYYNFNIMVHHSDYLISNFIPKYPADKLNQIHVYVYKELLYKLK